MFVVLCRPVDRLVDFGTERNIRYIPRDNGSLYIISNSLLRAIALPYPKVRKKVVETTEQSGNNRPKFYPTYHLYQEYPTGCFFIYITYCPDKCKGEMYNTFNRISVETECGGHAHTQSFPLCGTPPPPMKIKNLNF